MMPTTQLEPSGSQLSTPPQSPAVQAGSASESVQYARAFAGLFLRDLHVLRRELLPFVIRVCMNPMLFLFVFSGIAAVALPLAQEFGITREIDDRVMCPLPVAAVAIEKICFSAMQSVIAAAVVFPLAYYIPTTPVVAHVTNWPYLIVVLVLASLTSGALGLTIGTTVKPAQIGLIFGVVVMPITFLGCVYYPWAALDKIHWLQMGVLVNPIVYMSEGLRSALTPMPHMSPVLILSMLIFFLALLTWLGIRGFLRRVIG
jgi:ABC-2 type transport system permease protein